METTYGIGVKNRYDIFYNEDVDPFEILKQQELERQKQRERKEKDKSSKDNKTIIPAKINTKKIINQQQPAKPPQEIPPTKKEVQENKPKSSSRQNERNVKFSPNTREQPRDVEERNNRKNREERPIPSTDFNRDLSGEIRGRGRGGNARIGNRARGRGRGTFENRGGFDNRGKREFDRQSGSDKRYSDHSSVKAVDKRDGAGSHNWGTIRDDIDDQMHETTVTEETPDWGAVERSEEPETIEKKEPVETEVPEQTVEMEEEVKEMTLDEWKKQQERLRSRSNFRLRKAGEGEDNTQWKKTFLLKKTEGAESGDEEEEEEELEEESVRRGRQKHLVEIEINFSDSRRSRGRGGRGGVGNRGSRGGRGGRGNARGRGTPGSAAPKVDDENDFPSLVK